MQAILAVNEFDLDGIEISAKLKREYPEKELFAHVLGYVGRINESELKNIDTPSYRGTDSIGKTGLEKFYESKLLGQVGSQNVETNARGRVMRTLGENQPTAGNNLILTLDKEIQLTAFNEFQGRKGALVALDVKSGEILALMSSPSYDPNLFISGITQEKYSALLKSDDKPLFNRAVAGQYPPGSTIKPLVALAALEQGFDPNKRINCDGSYEIKDTSTEKGTKSFHCWKEKGHGPMNMKEAIQKSCDVYFYTVAREIGINKIAEVCKRFGLGEKVFDNFVEELSGTVHNKQWKKKNIVYNLICLLYKSDSADE